MHDDENTVKATLQQVFEAHTREGFFPKSARLPFKRLLGKHLISPSKKVRKWAYHCACYYYDEDIYQKIKIQLQKETEIENIMWALSALSVTYDNATSLQQCVGARHEEFLSTISENYLSDALCLFGGVVDINPQTILLTNNSADLAALAKIYGYPDIAREKYPTITESIMQEIKNHPDNYVREYAYWSLFLGGSSESHLLEPEDQTFAVRKFQIALQIQNGDRDFVISTLKPLKNRPSIIPRDIKNGILLGLKKGKYVSAYAPYIGGWFTAEEDHSICCLLLEYMIKHCYSNRDDGTYFDVLKDSLKGELLGKYVANSIQGNTNCNLTISRAGNEYLLDFTKKEHNTMGVTVTGDGNTIVTGANSPIVSGSGNTVVAGNGNSVNVNTPPEANAKHLEAILTEIKKIAQTDLLEKDAEAAAEYVETISQEVNAEHPKKWTVHQMVEGLKTLKGTAEFFTAVMKLVDILKNFV